MIVYQKLLLLAIWDLLLKIYERIEPFHIQFGSQDVFLLLKYLLLLFSAVTQIMVLVPGNLKFCRQAS
jgi:hypothetical protein